MVAKTEIRFEERKTFVMDCGRVGRQHVEETNFKVVSVSVSVRVSVSVSVQYQYQWSQSDCRGANIVHLDHFFGVAHKKNDLYKYKFYTVSFQLKSFVFLFSFLFNHKYFGKSSVFRFYIG